MAHQQHQVKLKKRSVALTVRVQGAHHDQDHMEGKRCPANQKRPEQYSKSQGPPHAAAPPPLPPAGPSTAAREGRNLPGVDPRQQEHVDVQEADNHQGDHEDDHKADHEERKVEEPHHEQRRHPTRRPDEPQDGRRALHRHDVVVSESVEDSDVAAKRNSKMF